MSNIIIPLIIMFILIYGIYKRRNIYEDFLVGAKEGIILVYTIIPAIIAMNFAINIFLKSNVINIFYNYINFIKIIPSDIIPLAILRPISGNATLSIMASIFERLGPDSFAGRLASTMQGCTDTTIYVLALYFSSVKITNTRYALFVGLCADLIGIISSIIIVYIFFN